MEHVRKRRRIDTLASPSEHDLAYDEEDLHPEVRERLEVRNRFKSQLERIFEKYDRDFTGIGDEIDLVTGEVVVNNGHLLGMQEEDDVGDDITDQGDSAAEEEEGLSASENESQKPGQQSPLRLKSDNGLNDDETLESLNIDSTFAGGLYTPRSQKHNSMAQATDPRWQIPIIPEIGSQNESEAGEGIDQEIGTLRHPRTDIELAAVKSTGKAIPKSPGGSLWKFPKIRKRASAHRSKKGQSGTQTSIWNDDLALSEDSCSENDQKNPESVRLPNQEEDQNNTIPLPLPQNPLPGEDNLENESAQLHAEPEANSQTPLSVAAKDGARSEIASSTAAHMIGGSNNSLQEVNHATLALRTSPQQLNSPRIFNQEHLRATSNQVDLKDGYDLSGQPRIAPDLELAPPMQEILQDSSNQRQLKNGFQVLADQDTKHNVNSQNRSNSAIASPSDRQPSRVVRGYSDKLTDSANNAQPREQTELGKLVSIGDQIGKLRESSPLSSLSSSDSRIAKSFELSRANGVGKPPGFPQETSTSAIALSTPKDLGTADNEPTTDDCITKPLPNDSKSRSSSTPGSCDQPPMPSKKPNLVSKSSPNASHPAFPDGLDLAESIEPTEAEANVIISGEMLQKQQRNDSEEPGFSMANMNDLFRSMNDSFMQSELLLETAAKRKSYTTPHGAKIPKSVNKPFVPVRPLGVSAATTKAVHYPHSSKGWPQIQSRPSDLSAAEIMGPVKVGFEPNPSTPIRRVETDSREAPNHKSTLQSKSQSPRRSKDNSETAAIRSHSTAKAAAVAKRSDAPRRQRERTPIDTFCYILADPWPIDPLPGDRIPGMEPSHQQRQSQRQDVTKEAVQGRSPKPATKNTSINETSPSFPSHLLHESKNVTKKKEGTSQSQSHIRDSDLGWQGGSSQSLRPKNDSKPRTNRASSQVTNKLINQTKFKDLATAPDPTTPALSTSTNILDYYPFPESPGKFPAYGSSASSRSLSPAYKEADIIYEFGRGHPLTRANLLSQDEVPSTSQETIMSFLNSQTTPQFSRTATLKSSQLGRRPQASRQSINSTKTCGMDGFRCGRRYCFNCTSTAATQEDIEF